jgi:hypothetical protein
MNAKKTNKNEIVMFFILSFVISWLLWLPKLLADNNIGSLPAFLTPISNLATFGPFIAAFWLTYKASGRTGTKALWKRGWDFSFDKKWLWVILLIPLVTSGLTILAMDLFGSPIQWDQAPLPLSFAVPIFFIIFLTQALPEEYGWRGFALDRLQLRWNALTASLILGFLWGLWHLPLHFMVGTTQEVIPIYQFVLKQMLGAIFFTWIYNNSNRNVFLAILMHAIWNVFGGLVPYWISNQGRWINFSIELALALFIVLIYGAKTLTKRST